MFINFESLDMENVLINMDHVQVIKAGLDNRGIEYITFKFKDGSFESFPYSHTPAEPSDDRMEEDFEKIKNSISCISLDEFGERE